MAANSEINTDRLQKKAVMQLLGEPRGGIRKHVHDLIDGLQEHYQIIYAYSDLSVDSQGQEDLLRYRNLEIELVPLHVEKQPHYTDILNLIKLHRFLKSNPPALIHAHGSKAGLYARLITAWLHVPVIYTPHGGVAHDSFGGISQKLYRGIERWLNRYTDFYLFESGYTKQKFEDIVGVERLSNCLVNYGGLKSVNQIRKKDIYSAGVTHIGLFGMLRHHKGQHIAIEAAKLLSDKKVPFELHLYGNGPDEANLKKRVLGLGLMDTVTFHGDVAPALDYMVEMDLIWMPSIFESMGYVALEVWQLGIPMIISDAGGLKEVAKLLSIKNQVKAGEVEQLAEETLRMIGIGLDREKNRQLPTIFNLSEQINVARRIYDIVSSHPNTQKSKTFPPVTAEGMTRDE